MKDEMAEIERLNDEIRALVRERQALRSRGAGRDELEQNRQEIVGRQWQLTRVLGAVHAPDSTRRAA